MFNHKCSCSSWLSKNCKLQQPRENAEKVAMFAQQGCWVAAFSQVQKMKRNHPVADCLNCRMKRTNGVFACVCFLLFGSMNLRYRNYPPTWTRFTAESAKILAAPASSARAARLTGHLASSGSAPMSCWREMPSGASSEAWRFLCLGVKLCQFVMTKVSQMSCFSWDWDQCAAFSSTFSHVSSSTLVLHVGKSHEFMPICIIPQRLCFVPGCPRDQARTHNYTSCHSTRTPVTRFGLRMSQDVLWIEISSSWRILIFIRKQSLLNKKCVS